MPRERYPDTLPELFERAVTRGGTRAAVVRGVRELTYDDVDRLSATYAAGLRAAGVEFGDRVAVLFANRLETPVIDAAIARAGAVRVPLNPMYSEREIEHVLRDAGVSAIITDEDRIASIGESAVVSSVSNRFAFGDVSGTEFESVAGLRSERTVPDAADVEPTDTAAIYYTGGTTGKPKGVVYSQRVLVRNYLAHLAEFDVGTDDVGLLTAPLSHSAGTFLWTALLAGSRVVIQDGFDVGRVTDAIEARGVSWTMVVPTMLYRLLDAPTETAETIRELDRIYYGTAPARPSKLAEAVERFGPILVQFYGQTEVPNLITTFSASAHASAVASAETERLQSAGTPALQVGLRIVDVDTGEPLPPGAVGEILAAAPYVFVEYHDRPAATAETKRDGWVHTGDIGRIDEDGFLTLLDRTANVVTTGGMNVYTREIESVLTSHPGVDEAAVIGIPDDDWGEAVHAIVVPGPEADLSSAALVEYVAERVASYKKPKSIEFRASVPRTALGKIERESLRSEFWAGADRSVH